MCIVNVQLHEYIRTENAIIVVDYSKIISLIKSCAHVLNTVIGI